MLLFSYNSISSRNTTCWLLIESALSLNLLISIVHFSMVIVVGIVRRSIFFDLTSNHLISLGYSPIKLPNLTRGAANSNLWMLWFAILQSCGHWRFLQALSANLITRIRWRTGTFVKLWIFESNYLIVLTYRHLMMFGFVNYLLSSGCKILLLVRLAQTRDPALERELRGHLITVTIFRG